MACGRRIFPKLNLEEDQAPQLRRTEDISRTAEASRVLHLPNLNPEPHFYIVIPTKADKVDAKTKCVNDTLKPPADQPSLSRSLVSRPKVKLAYMPVYVSTCSSREHGDRAPGVLMNVGNKANSIPQCKAMENDEFNKSNDINGACNLTEETKQQTEKGDPNERENPRKDLKPCCFAVQPKPTSNFFGVSQPIPENTRYSMFATDLVTEGKPSYSKVNSKMEFGTKCTICVCNPCTGARPKSSSVWW